eukprot:scaffold11458_cov66-Phaeocystis_antarctica.AAC.2
MASAAPRRAQRCCPGTAAPPCGGARRGGRATHRRGRRAWRRYRPCKCTGRCHPRPRRCPACA